MPKITSSLYLAFAGKSIQMDLWYDQKNLFHFKSFPSEWRTIGGFVNQAESQNALMQLAKAAIAKTEETMKNVTFVLHVTFKASEMLSKNRTPARHGGHYLTENGEFETRFTGNDSGYGFRLDWAIRAKEITGDKVVYKSVDKQDDGSFKIGYNAGEGINCNNMGYIEMLWTQEREDFFLAMGQATKKIALQIAGFLGQDSDMLAKMIDLGTSPLLQSTNEP